MHSISKNHISADVAAAIVRDAYGESAALRELRELTDGYFNAAYLLELSDDRRRVLKIAPPAQVAVLRYERDIMPAEVAALELVRERTNVPVPAVDYFDRAGRHAGSPCFIMGFVRGTALNILRPKLPAAALPPLDRAIGGFLREINAIEGEAFGYATPSAPRFASWREAFLAMLGGVLADGDDLHVTLPRPSAMLYEQAARLASALDSVGTPRLLHWDLWDGNIFVDPYTTRVIGLIDFERALWGDPLMEAQFRTSEVSPDFLAGYGANPLAAAGAAERRTLYNIYLYLIMIIECFYRHFETRDQELWARAQLDQELAKLDALASPAS